MTTNMPPIIVIGAGQAAAQFVQSARKRGIDLPIAIYGEEPHLPYQRPPLSKAYLKGEFAEERLYFKPADYYEGQNAIFHPNSKVVRIDPVSKEIELNTGERASYTKLVIATGSRPRPLPDNTDDIENVYELRSISDSQGLAVCCGDVRHLTIIGGGYIGLEVAAVACSLGLEVTVIEREERLLARVTSPVVSDFYAQLHRDHGIDLRLGAHIEHFDLSENRIRHVRLTNGEIIPTDAVLVGIGGLPNQELAESAGLDCAGGIVVDEDARTSDPHIYATGDCARRPLPGRDKKVRLESVHNALDQADLAAAHIAEAARPVSDIPWFWSDQFDVKLQTAGLFTGYTDCITRGTTNKTPFSVFYFADDKLIAADCLNDPAAFLTTKQLLKFGLPVDKEMLGNPDIAPKDILAQAKEQVKT